LNSKFDSYFKAICVRETTQWHRLTAIGAEADVNAQGSEYGSALQGASMERHYKSTGCLSREE